MSDTDSTYSQDTGSTDTTVSEIQEVAQQFSIINSLLESIQSTVMSLISTGYDRQDEKLIQWIRDQPLTTSTTPIAHILSQYK
jgi:hypothetical protein